MNFAEAIRWTELLLGFALMQQSAEYLSVEKGARQLFLLRFMLSTLLMIGGQNAWICLALFISSLFMLQRFQGPYNGGSDRMGLLILCGLCLVHLLPNMRGQEVAFGYIALQLVLSYFIAGWVKILNPDWRNGQALKDVFLFSAYPASEGMRSLAEKPRLLCIMCWAVMLFELLFPLMLLSQTTLIMGLIIAACFHFANACLFGFNRFFWVWLAAYPSIFWLQQRIIS